MIASVLRLSRRDCEKLRLKDVYGIHKAVYSLFPEKDGETRSFLFADKGGDFFERRILILSKNKPVEPEFGQIESKEIPISFLENEYYAFEVIVNPVKRDNKTRAIIPIRGRENLLDWFAKKASSLGFTVLKDSLTVQDTEIVQFVREKNERKENITLGKARFIGKLQVTNKAAFINTFENGIGKGKAFGFGLFQIVPITLNK